MYPLNKREELIKKKEIRDFSIFSKKDMPELTKIIVKLMKELDSIYAPVTKNQRKETTKWLLILLKIIKKVKILTT